MIRIVTDCENTQLIDDLQRLAQRAAAVLDEFKGADELAVDFCFVDEQEMAQLNYSARGKEGATDVLSFPCLKHPFTLENNRYDYDEDLNALMLGQVVICVQVAQRQAEQYLNSFEQEVAYLFIHSLLHLAGYDHQTQQDKERMRAAEKTVLLQD